MLLLLFLIAVQKRRQFLISISEDLSSTFRAFVVRPHSSGGGQPSQRLSIMVSPDKIPMADCAGDHQLNSFFPTIWTFDRIGHLGHLGFPF